MGITQRYALPTLHTWVTITTKLFIMDERMQRLNHIVLTVLTSFLLTSCSINPFRGDNDMTGKASSTLIGAGAAGGIAYIAGASKPEIGVAGLLGGALGYYASTLSFTAGGITHVGGNVFSVGDFVTVEIPAERVFDVNSADFLPEATPILNSVVAVLMRNPGNNIMVSGNTSGFYSSKIEHKLSENRARQVAAFLWANGINNFNDENSNYASLDKVPQFSRTLKYVGYGNYFPIANNITAEGIFKNDRIQITSYPPKAKLNLSNKEKVFANIGGSDFMSSRNKNQQVNVDNAFRGGTSLPENGTVAGDTFKDSNQVTPSYTPPTQGYKPDESDLKSDSWDNDNSFASSPSTRSGGSVVKQGGFKGEGYKGG